MGTFTIFFCGTGSNSHDFGHKNYQRGELVSTLSSNHLGVEFVDWIIVDGPGSGNLQEDEKWTKPGHYSGVRGGVFGAGWEENVAHAIAVLKKKTTYQRTHHTDKQMKTLKKVGVPVGSPVRNVTQQALQQTRANLKTPPKSLAAGLQGPLLPSVPQALLSTVNLVGWSRGGVTCHMMANAMMTDPDLAHIPVNIFTVDPVPGAGNFQRSRVSIGRNVRDYTAVYARDERSICFSATVPITGNIGLTQMYVLPGRHATVAGNAFADGGVKGAQIFSAPGRIVRHLAEQFLFSRGTKLRNMLALDNVNQLKLYDEMIRHDGTYQAMRKRSYLFIAHGKDRPTGVGRNWSSIPLSKVVQLNYRNPVFVNWHHERLFVNSGAIKSEELMALLPNTAQRIARFS